jgi:hypothetical protein
LSADYPSVRAEGKPVRILQHPVPDEHLKHIGDMTVSFAMLETVIQFFIGMFFADNQRIAQIVMAELSFNKLRALLISLYLECYGEDDDFKTLRSLMQRAAATEEKRNKITHSIWGAGDDTDTITRIKTTAKEKHGIRFHHEKVSSGYLSSFVIEIKSLASEIQDFSLALADQGKPFKAHGS